MKAGEQIKVNGDKAEFIEEVHEQDDLFTLYFRYEGVKFSIPAHGRDRYLVPELIEIHSK